MYPLRPERFVGNPDLMLAIQLFGSMSMRSLTAPRMPLLTAQITLRGLDGHATKKELYLLQFSASRVAEPSARSAKIVRCKSLDTCFMGVLPDDVPNCFFRQSIAPGFPILVYAPKQFAGCEIGGLNPLIEQRLNPAGHQSERLWNAPDCQVLN